MGFRRCNGVFSKRKERRKATGADKTKIPTPTTMRGTAARSTADQQRATQLLETAKKRDLTADELKVLSVVQLSAYATIQRDRQKRKNCDR
jgi:hypothetical protein